MWSSQAMSSLSGARIVVVMTKARTMPSRTRLGHDKRSASLRRGGSTGRLSRE
jgi:hypothetical protein